MSGRNRNHRFSWLSATRFSGLVHLQCMLFFYDDRPAIPQSDEVAELSKLDLERMVLEKKQSWSGNIGIPAWFDAGGRLFALQRYGEYVSFGWAMRSKTFGVSEVNGIVRLNEEMLWIWNCFTPTEHRGKGYYPALLTGIRRALQFPPTVIYCVTENHPSRRGIEKAGFRLAFSITQHRLFVFCRQTIRGLYAGYRRA
jgi:RimJ/RimL family protein N-acetyltransferase